MKGNKPIRKKSGLKRTKQNTVKEKIPWPTVEHGPPTCKDIS